MFTLYSLYRITTQGQDEAMTDTVAISAPAMFAAVRPAAETERKCWRRFPLERRSAVIGGGVGARLPGWQRCSSPHCSSAQNTAQSSSEWNFNRSLTPKEHKKPAVECWVGGGAEDGWR